MRILGICSSGFKVLDQEILCKTNYEIASLHYEANIVYDKTLLINPRHVFYQFLRGKKPDIYYRGEDISDINTLIVRGVAGAETEIFTLVHSLSSVGCDLFNEIENFTGSKPTKLISTIKRHRDGVGTDTYIAFCFEQAAELLMQIWEKKHFPIVTKPIDGNQGKEVVKHDQIYEALDLCQDHFTKKKDALLIQRFMLFQQEYRVIVVNGEILGVAQKVSRDGSFIANAARGATFVTTDAPHIVDFVSKYIKGKGIYGVDVAVDNKNNIHIIESNRTPSWKSFEKATGVNVAKEVIQRAFRSIA